MGKTVPQKWQNLQRKIFTDSNLDKAVLYTTLIGFLHFRPPKIYARKITTLENPPKAQHFLNTHSPSICGLLIFLHQKLLCATPSGYAFCQRS
jgi:hypothetical protein